MKLEHMALYTIIKNVKYDGSNNVIENALFEIDQIIPKLEEELEEHIKQVPSMPTVGINFTSYNRVNKILSIALFDDFTLYTDQFTTREHVEWKEYFHSIYHFVAIHEYQESTLLRCTLKYYDILTPPTMVAEDDHKYSIINYITNLFKSMKEEHSIIASQVSIESYRDAQIQYGMKQLDWSNERRQMEDSLKKYNEIIQWSLH